MTQKCQGCQQTLALEKFISGMKRCKDCTNKRRTGIKCSEENCQKRASFGLDTDRVRRWCKRHRDVCAIYLTSKTCEKCSKQPSYGLKSDKVKQWCVIHKKKDAVDLVSKKCEYVDCSKQASFGFEIDKIKQWCAQHKDICAVYLLNKKCEYVDCSKQASFGFESDGVKHWCAKHRDKDAIDLKNKKCEYPNCCKYPSFGFELDNVKRWCVIHKKKDAVDLLNRKCEYVNCSKRPIFGIELDKVKRWCNKHKKKDTVDLVHKRCEYVSCSKRSIFGLELDGIKRRCGTHKNKDDIDLNCRHCDECKTRATYGLIGTLPSKCTSHKTEGMYLNPLKKCMKKGCNELATHGCSRRQIHCALHKTGNDIIVAEYKCKKCNKLDILDENELCVMDCAYSTNESFKKQEKKDEKRILSILTKEFGEPFSYDKTVPNNCKGKERPDILYEFIEQKMRIIIEIDENGDSHGSDCSGLTKDENEINRMKNIYHSLAETVPTVFIRYNPNSFYINNIKQNVSKTEREITLIKWIHKLLKEPDGCLLRVLYLFYDQHSPSTTKVKKIDITTDKFYQCQHCLSQCEYKRAPRQFLYYDKKEMKKHIQVEHTG